MKSQLGVSALVIDDDRDQYELIKAMLTLEGYSVLTADNAEDGLRYCKQYYPFIVLSDFSMPGTNGAELIQRLRRECAKETPVIIISAFSPDYVRQNLHPNFQPEAIMTKPVDFERLLGIIHSHYQRQRQQLTSCAA